IGDEPLAERLQAFLRDKVLLLVLDNFEHLLSASQLVAVTLAACLQAKVLVTSREVLRVSGEHDFLVPPLALPDLARLPPLKQTAQCEAVRLFIQRAVAAKANFALTEANAVAVTSICHRLDGLPLGIELAAARVGHLPPPALLAQLEWRLPLLTGGPRDQPVRLQTMRNAIAWSYDLLDANEQQLFRRLSLFSGSFTLQAAEALGAAEHDLDLDVLEGVASLVKKSLLRPGEPSDGEALFTMLETIREFGLEQLAARGETAEFSRRHAAWYLALAERVEPDLYGGRRQRSGCELLESELDNLRAALSWLIDSGAAEDALRLATALLRFWYTRGYLSEGRDWLERVLALADATPP
ncbi:MAG: ATP-binding protein, partial [Dehalococcoidia bacterium]